MAAAPKPELPPVTSATVLDNNMEEEELEEVAAAAAAAAAEDAKDRAVMVNNWAARQKGCQDDVASLCLVDTFYLAIANLS